MSCRFSPVLCPTLLSTSSLLYRLDLMSLVLCPPLLSTSSPLYQLDFMSLFSGFVPTTAVYIFPALFHVAFRRFCAHHCCIYLPCITGLISCRFSPVLCPPLLPISFLLYRLDFMSLFSGFVPTTAVYIFPALPA